jgi:hypothetical protein
MALFLADNTACCRQIVLQGYDRSSGSHKSSGFTATFPQFLHLYRIVWTLFWQNFGALTDALPHQSAFVPLPCILQIPSRLSDTAPQLAQIKAGVFL